VNKRTPLIERDDMHANYLVNVTVGEDYAPCRSCPSQTCEAEKVYEFNQEVWIQCVTDSGINGTAGWYSLTTDFCYVHDTDFWESPEGDCEFPCWRNGHINKRDELTCVRRLSDAAL
jgi:hypothetical protein